MENTLSVTFLAFNLTQIPWVIILMLVALVVLLLMSAMASGSEVAFFSLSPSMVNELEEDQSDQSQTILKLVKSPRELLATILIFNNFINVAVILLSSLISASLFSPADMMIYGWALTGTLQVFLVNVVLITFVLLVFGEVVPKVYATQQPMKLLNKTVFVLDVINSFLIKTRLTPLLVRSTNLFSIEPRVNAHNITVDDLQHALDLTSQANVEPEETKILEGIVKFGNTDVKQIMTPRVQSVLIELEVPFNDVIKLVKESHFSRIPVYEDSIDHVKGVLYAKDLLPYLNKEDFDWKSLLRPPFFVPENKKIDDLLKEFQSKKTHLAIVVDEYGGVSGLVSLEDVIGEIVGDITDEFDDDDLFYSKLSENSFVFEGQTSLINMYRALGVEGEEFENQKGEADSVAGFVLEIAGRIPLEGESIEFNNCTFTIESADRRRIKRVKIDVNR